MKSVEEQIFETLENGGLNWKVTKENLLLPDGTETGFFGAVRSDNRSCLGTCTKQYEVFQNSEMIELAYKLSEETGYKMKNPNCYADGKRVSVDLKGSDKLLEYKEVGDVVEKNIRITNTHDGTGSLRLALGSLVLSCTNGQTRWIADKKTSIRHTTNMRKMLDDALRGFEVVKSEEKKMENEIDLMIEKEIRKEDIRQMIEGIVEVDMSLIGKDVEGNYTSKEVSTRKLNKIKSIEESIIEECSYKGLNVWGLLNGITHYTTHKGGRNETREDSKVFGGLMRSDKKAYDLAVGMLV